MLNNPTPVIYQNLKMAMKEQPEKSVETKKTGLLAPSKTGAQKYADQDNASPAVRIAAYVKQIQDKREEINNG